MSGDRDRGRRQTFRTGGFEDVGGYSRAVRSYDYIAVSGTAATDSAGHAMHSGDVGAQAQEAFQRALDAVEALGGSAHDVVRTRIFLADGVDWRPAIEAHQEFFGESRPANTTLYVSRFPPEGVLVEVELDAIVGR